MPRGVSDAQATASVAVRPSQYEPVSESPEARFTDAITVDESCLVLPDIELPYQNAAFVNNCIQLAHSLNIRTLVAAGDWIHWATLAKFFEAEKDTEAEIDKIEDNIRPFLTNFDRIYYIAGNHDRRPQRMFDRFVGADKITRLAVPPELAQEFSEKVRASDYYWCWVGTGADRWRIIHPQATNVVPANAARRIAEKFNCNVAMAHNHLYGCQQTQDGRHLGVEIGCCVDPERLAYYMSRDMTRPVMTNGALILERSVDGTRFYPTMLSREWTNWNAEIKDQPRKRRGVAAKNNH